MCQMFIFLNASKLKMLIFLLFISYFMVEQMFHDNSRHVDARMMNVGPLFFYFLAFCYFYSQYSN